MKKVDKSKPIKKSPDQFDISDYGLKENQGQCPQIVGIINQNQASGSLNEERPETKHLILEDEFKQKQYNQPLKKLKNLKPEVQ